MASCTPQCVVAWFHDHAPTAALLALAFTLAYLIGSVSPPRSAFATYPESWGLALQRGYTVRDSAGAAGDFVTNTGYWDGTNWQRATAGVLGGGSGFASDNFNQEALSTTSEAIPAPALTGRVLLRVFNQDTAINVFCKNGAAATSSNGVMIEPRTGRAFPATGTVQCIAASGTPTVDFEEYAP